MQLLQTPPAETTGFRFNHTMLRVRDARVSVQFYTEVLGMRLIDEEDMGDFTLYFLGFPHAGDVAGAMPTHREGVLELTHNHGTESDAAFAGYASGNSDPGRGFGHLAVVVPDIEAACARFETLGVQWKKRLTDGKMKNIAFLLDPDGYWIEVVPDRLKL